MPDTTKLQIFYAAASQYLGEKFADDVPLPDLLQKLFAHVLKPETTGQEAVTGAVLTIGEVGPFSAKFFPKQVRQVNDKLVAILYEKKPHPFANMTGIDWRSSDGSDPLGKSSYPYARSVPVDPKKQKPTLPDPGLVFKELMQRERDPTTGEEKTAPNPDGLSALLFAFGTLVIHSVFHTNLKNPRGKAIGVNESSSYFDLSLLYGDNAEEVDQMRNQALGRGYIAVDCFSDNRVLLGSMAGAALLVLFNRNHNYIADKLLELNERGRWKNPPPENPRERQIQDEEIFQTARLINCMHFINIVITDYVGSIMGVAQRGGGWPGNAEPLEEITLDGRRVSRGDGNIVSLEFNILYRWHATLSKEEVKWTEDRIAEITQNKDVYKLKPIDYSRLQQIAESREDPVYRTFAGLVKDKNGFFKDSELAAILYGGTESMAGPFRARGNPQVLGFVDVMGIIKAREWNVCTLNEFRKYLGLREFKDFRDWNQKKEIAEAAEKLYGNINNLELYPGLHAEGNTRDMTGEVYTDLLRAHTMRNGLLFDAIALIRGDRFATTMCTPENLTKWGFEDVKRDPNNAAYGGHIHKLLMRLLPDDFPDKNVYTWFPMVVPSALKAAGTLKGDWDFSRPGTSKK